MACCGIISDARTWMGINAASETIKATTANPIGRKSRLTFFQDLEVSGRELDDLIECNMIVPYLNISLSGTVVVHFARRLFNARFVRMVSYWSALYSISECLHDIA